MPVASSNGKWLDSFEETPHRGRARDVAMLNLFNMESGKLKVSVACALLALAVQNARSPPLDGCAPPSPMGDKERFGERDHRSRIVG